MKGRLLLVICLMCCRHAFAQDAPRRPDLKDDSLQKVYRETGKHPQFKGGADDWRAFLTATVDTHVITELADHDASIERTGLHDRVLVRFIVCEDGSICNVSVANKDQVHPELAAEAMRVLRLSPAWSPGELDGRPVKTWFTQPIIFALEKGRHKDRKRRNLF